MGTVIILLAVLIVFVIAGAIWLAIRFKKPVQDQSVSLFQQQLENLRENLRQTLVDNTNQVTLQLKNNIEAMLNTNKTVGDRLDTAAKVVSDLSVKMTKVEDVSKRMLEVGKDIASLQQILKAPKLRGSFGEYLLADLLSQMLPQDNYELQYGFKNGERVDAVIKTAQGIVPIDAKFPLESFQRLIATNDEDEKKQHRKEFITQVKKHITDISQKYIKPGEGTFDFALMYIPAENVYYEVITKGEEFAETTTIAEFAFAKKVFPVSPNSFYAYLNTILVGLRGMQVEKNVKKILVELGRLKKRFDAFTEDFDKIGAHITNANSAYSKAGKHLEHFEGKLNSIDTPALDDAGVEVPPNQSPKELVQ